MDFSNLLGPLVVPVIVCVVIWLFSLESRLGALKRSVAAGRLAERTRGAAPLTAPPRPAAEKPRAAPSRPMPPEVEPRPAPVDLPVEVEAVAAATPAVATPPPPRAVLVETSSSATKSARSRRAESAKPAMSLESFLGGRVLLFAGVIAVLFGIAFFLKMAIERGMFPPQLRILCGALAGAGALFGGDRLRKRGFDVFGHALMGCGQGALYLCIYFASLKYGFIGNGAAFVMAGALTALGVGLAWFRQAPALAYLGFLGGFLAPAFFGQATDTLYPLAAWLLVLDMGIGVVTLRRRWHGLDLMALAASALYLLVAAVQHEAVLGLTHIAVVLGCLVTGKLVMAMLPALVTGRRTSITGLLTAIGAGLWGVTMAIPLLYEQHATELGLGVLGLAGVCGAFAVALPARRDGTASPETPIFGACALAAAAGALPILFDGLALATTWAAFGTATVFIGCRRRLELFRVAGVIVNFLAVAALVPADYHSTSFVPFLSAISFSYAMPLVALAASGWLLRTQSSAEDATSRAMRGLGGVLIVIAAWLGVPYVIAEISTALDYANRTMDAAGRHARLAIVAASLAGYAGVLVAATWTRARRALVLAAGPLVVSLAVFGLMLGGNRGGSITPFLNVTGVCGAVVLAALGVFLARLGQAGRRFGTFLLAGGVLGLITSELYWWGEGRTALDHAARLSARRTAQAIISIAWAVSGAVSLALGFLRGRLPESLARDLRWTGLALLFGTVGKVFLVDLARLDTVSKVGSFLVLGVLMVAGSFLYQKARKASTHANELHGE